MSNNFSVSYRIYYEDTDAGGVVYYANYLKFFERARTEFLRQFSLVQSQLLTEEKIAFVVRKCVVDYLSPARLDDFIKVEVVVKELKNLSIVFQQTISKENKVLSTLEVEIVCVDSENFRPKKIPQNIKDLINVR